MFVALGAPVVIGVGAKAQAAGLAALPSPAPCAENSFWVERSQTGEQGFWSTAEVWKPG